MFNNVSIIGDGAMGTVLAMMLCEKGVSVRMWSYDRQQLDQIKQAGQNVKFLPGYDLPKSLVFEPDDGKITKGADLIVSAVPCQFMRSVWKRLQPYCDSDIPIVTVAKGIENDTLARPDEILKEILGDDAKIIVLSGPTIAEELARKLPATAAAACVEEALAQKVQYTFTLPYFRVYTNSDIVGVELAGAMKNVIAIAAGIIDGIKAGDNAKAALLSRGLAEISRLGEAMGANPQTFSGLTGLGDLVTTCISPKGRNRSLGQRIGNGMSLDQALAATNSVVEGVATCKSVCSLAKKYSVEMPITQAVYQILFENKPVSDAIAELMRRELKSE
ncbi:MAG: NAD(P)-dependent glycerol-3-phosphate dehydrogenase [Sedimentisphaerales bacterium]|nr:NAD(P)-dependent glycerol-3-phosphate dehydrogenase [Sedimentisphaerales bacterium]